MSDDERDIDIESDDETPSASPNFHTQADKRAHHNALERKRRDHIKDSFSGLRDSIPSLQGEKASRAQILKKAAEYIQYMRRKNQTHQQDIDDLKRQNQSLEQQIQQHDHDSSETKRCYITTGVPLLRSLEKARSPGNFVTSIPTDSMSVSSNSRSNVSSVDGGSESSDSESSSQNRPKKLKTAV